MVEGKGETRLRNEQESENKVEADPAPAKRAKKTKYYFLSDFLKNVSGAFQTPTSERFDLFNLRARPFPFPAYPWSPDSAWSGLSFVCSDMSKGRARSWSWLFGSGGRKKNEMMDRLVAHHPITPRQPNHFLPPHRLCGECRIIPSDFHPALLFPIHTVSLPVDVYLSHGL